ncbi:hypothetical protein A2U01_0102640, partial [Trifolium medium]|nr:hypothetical protein [Trifolium medium]
VLAGHDECSLSEGRRRLARVLAMTSPALATSR